MFFFDPLGLAVTALGAGLSLWAQFRVQSTFREFQSVGVRAGMTGAQAAAAVCRASGIQDVRIERHAGFLSDHYDPRDKTLRLSPEVFDGRSVSSIAVAAHEAGHAVQDATGYAWLGMRSALVPITGFGSRFWWIPMMLGALLIQGAPALGQAMMNLAIVLFGLVVLFQLVTLPVEFDASKRAKLVLASSGIVSTRAEAEGVEKVLGAAAMTYVAAAAASVMHLVYMILRARSNQ